MQEGLDDGWMPAEYRNIPFEDLEEYQREMAGYHEGEDFVLEVKIEEEKDFRAGWYQGTIIKFPNFRRHHR